MPATKPPRPGRPRSGRPRISDRNTLRKQISMLPDDAAALYACAVEWAEPGMPPNESAAWRRIFREWRAARGD
jgi:hypothetical protein